VSIEYQLGDPDKTLGELELTAKDKKIIKKGDVRAMFDMGVHPFLLNHLSFPPPVVRSRPPELSAANAWREEAG
jgi:hypothetical protein